MAETVHLFLKANGSDIKGESTQTSLGRDGSIECLYFEDSVRTAREKGSGMATGRRTYNPIIIRKRIDKEGLKVDLEVDGGIDQGNAKRVIAAGADVLVAGTATFRGGADSPALPTPLLPARSRICPSRHRAAGGIRLAALHR